MAGRRGLGFPRRREVLAQEQSGGRDAARKHQARSGEKLSAPDPLYSDMSSGMLFVVFVAVPLLALGSMVLYGWKRRKDRMPKVAPLPKDDDWD